MAVALLVAAGRGERLGAGGPKAFVVLAGRPMLEWSVDALRAVAAIDAIVVALPDGRATRPPGTIGVDGGAERSHSVRAALAAAPPARPRDRPRRRAPAGDARPRSSARSPRSRHGADAAIAAAPVTDTVKEARGDGRRAGTLDRSRLWAVQTPQVFRREALRARARRDRRRARARQPTTPALVEAAGRRRARGRRRRARTSRSRRRRPAGRRAAAGERR